MCDCDDSELVQYQADPNGEWKKSIYCSDCMTYIHNNCWRVAKQNLFEVDCLAAFRGIQDHGLPTTLVERDVLGNKSYRPIFMIRKGCDGTPRSAALSVDLTPEQIDNLVRELRLLDRKDVSSDDIHAIAKRYWNGIENDYTP